MDTTLETVTISTAAVGNGTLSINGTYTTPPVQTLPLDDIQYIYVTVTVFYVLVFLLGVLGNILVISVVCVQRDMRTPTNMFLVNLSVADLLVLFFCMPSSLIEFHAQEVWLLGDAMCKLTFFLEHAVAHTSILTILAISFERYYAICCPLQVLYTCTTRRAFKINAAVWLCGLLSALPFFFLAYTKATDHATAGLVEVCRLPIVSAWSRAYVIAIQLVFFAIPLIVLVALYIYICKALLKDPVGVRPTHGRSSAKQSDEATHSLTSKSKNGSRLKTPLGKTVSAHEKTRVRSSSASTHSVRNHTSTRRQIVCTVITIMILFFVCLLPLRVVTLWLIYSPQEDIQRLGLEGYLNLMAFVRIMFYLNSAGNPILYSLVSSKFRQAGRKALRCNDQSSRRSSFVSTNYRPSLDRCKESKQRSGSSVLSYAPKSEFNLSESHNDDTCVTQR